MISTAHTRRFPLFTGIETFPVGTIFKPVDGCGDELFEVVESDGNSIEDPLIRDCQTCHLCSWKRLARCNASDRPDQKNVYFRSLEF